MRATGDEVVAAQSIVQEGKKRVVCLYRVSTKGQVDKNDIPLQKSACRNFISTQSNWQLVKEYQEKGISGYKLSADDRDVLKQIKYDAVNGLFDVLLVFMFDRLGRKDDETPFVVEWFVQQGVEVWSVVEGQQRFEDHIDKLVNYLRFWQSSGESYKTSIRVDESHRQLTEAGIYRGGTPAYGYKLIPSGTFNKKGKELLTLALDEVESEVVKAIFQITVDKHWGGKKIAEFLNEKGVKSRTNKEWSGKTINTMLANPIYNGYLVYGDTRSQQISRLMIVDDKMWESVRVIKQAKRPTPIDPDNSQGVVVNSSSPLLLTGITKCGHCGSAITTTYNTKTWTNKDGTIKKYKAAKYRCSGKALGRKQCDGQTIYGKNKIEDIVLEEVKMYLQRLSQIDLKKEIEKMQARTLEKEQKELDNLQKNNEENYKELAVLQDEVAKSLMGNSTFQPEMLSKLISNKEKTINQNNELIVKLEESIRTSKVELNSALELQQTIPRWDEEFDKADTDRKKVLLRSIVSDVVVYRDEIKVGVKLHLQQFLQNFDENNEEVLGSAKNTRRESIGVVNTAPNIVFEEILKATYKVA
jgi:site-specific DNA recombinase